jgi:hypothetical protein
VWDREWVEVLKAQCCWEEGTFEVYPVLFLRAVTRHPKKMRRRMVLEKREGNPVELFAAQTFIKFMARKKTPFFTN